MSEQIRFSAVVEFSIDPTEAAKLLSQENGIYSVGKWMSSHTPETQDISAAAATNLRLAFGEFLVTQAKKNLVP